MARNISAAALAKLATRTGTEPVSVVEISWVDGAANGVYGEKAYPDLGIEGRILNLGQVDDAINYSRNGTTQSVTITLSDIDGQLKAKFDNCDMHKRPAFVYQWFDGIPYSDRFLIFQGQIASPITYKEGDRTLSFDIISEIDSLEVGFSPEDGQFPYIPQNLIGRAWPLIFGIAVQVPAILIDDIPHTGKQGSAADSISKDDHGVHDPSLDKKIEDNTLTANQAIALAQLDFIGYLQASFTARELGEIDQFADISTVKGGGTFTGLAKQYLNAGNKLLLQGQQLRLKNNALNDTLSKQKSFEKGAIGVSNGNNFPQGQTLVFNVGGMTLTGYFIGDTFIVQSRTHPNADLTTGMVVDPPDSRTGDPVITRDQFFFVPAGTPVLMADQLSAAFLQDPILPVRYIVSGVIPTDVLAIYAWRTVGGIKSLYQVPPSTFSNVVNNPTYIQEATEEDPDTGDIVVNYYSVWQVDFGTVIATVIYLPQPLSSYDGQGWEDDIWATLQSPVGPNVVDVLIWLIQNYTIYSYDPVSFSEVAAQVAAYPVNFAILDRPDIVQVLQDIAYQSRCFIWFKNGLFYLKYLSVEDTVTDTLTEADVLYNTYEIQSTETEDIVTKYIASWRADYFHEEPNKIILRRNINRYGLTEKDVDFYTYNTQYLVEKSATFWTLRLSNDFKILVFKVPITKLNIETMDTITLNFSNTFGGKVCNTTINGIVWAAKFDSAAYEIELTVWIPVLLGTLVRYDFAYPGDLSEQDVYPTFDDIQQGNVSNSGARLPSSLPPGGPASLKNSLGGDAGNGGQIHVTNHPYSWGVDPNQFADTNNVAPIITQRIDSVLNAFNRSTKKPPGTNQYQYDYLKVTDAAIQQPTSQPLPGKIVQQDEDQTYEVAVYFQGLDNDTTNVQGVRQIKINDDDQLPEGTPVMIARLVWQDDQGNAQVQYFMQSPTWTGSSDDGGDDGP